MASVRSEIEIDAPVERVSAILWDLDAYPEWNPFTQRVESTLRVGDRVDMQVRLVGERLSHRVEWVTAAVPNDRLCWSMTMGSKALLAAERCQTLERIGPERTRYVTEDVLRGLLSPVVMALFGRAMQRGFDDVATGLKKRAEG